MLSSVRSCLCNKQPLLPEQLRDLATGEHCGIMSPKSLSRSQLQGTWPQSMRATLPPSNTKMFLRIVRASITLSALTNSKNTARRPWVWVSMDKARRKHHPSSARAHTQLKRLQQSGFVLALAKCIVAKLPSKKLVWAAVAHHISR